MSQEPPKPSQASPTPTESANSAQTPAQRSKLQALLHLLGQLWGILLAFVPIALNLLRRLGQLTLAFLKWLRQWWAIVLPKVRAILPEPWKTRVPNFVITGIAVAILAFLLWLPVTLLSDRAATAIDKPITERRDTPSAKVVEPDPDRIAAIQEQVTDVTSQYAEGLIQAVQANFLRSRLTVSLSAGWYALSDSQREQLANDLLKRSKKLSFKTLEITDLEGTLLARSPVVGSNMIVLAAIKDEA